MLVFKSYLKQANGKILGNISPNSGNYEYLKIIIRIKKKYSNQQQKNYHLKGL